MFKINDNYLKLPGSYLFSTIGKKVKAFQEANPDKEIIRLDCAIDGGFNASAKYLVQLQGIPFTTVTRSGSSLSEPRIRSLQSFYEYAKAHDIL